MTDSQHKSYAIFSYKCGALNWNNADNMIGYRTPDDSSYHPLSSSPYPNAVACSNTESVWSNIVYDISPAQVSTSGAGFLLQPGEGIIYIYL